MAFFQELKRRNVFRVAAAYIVLGWLLLQVSDTLAPALLLPAWVHSTFAFLLIMGFPIAVFLAWVYELTPEGLRKEQRVDPGQSITHLTGRRLDFVIIALLAAALAYFAWEKYSTPDSNEQSNGSMASGESAQTDGAVNTASIAVLPFRNMSSDPENEYFSDGLTETLLHMLAQLKDLHVASRTSSFAFKDEDSDIRQIASALGVANVLEGSVQKSGKRVRITAQLIRAEDGFHSWSQTYDRTLDDIFAIQDEIARDVAEILGSTLLVTTGPTLHRSGTANVDAYDVYLRALEQQNSASVAGYVKAEELYQQALEIDPEYLDAINSLARLYLMQLDTRSRQTQDALVKKSEQLLSQALALQPDNLTSRQLGQWIRYLDLLVDSGKIQNAVQILDLLTQSLISDPSDSWLVSVVANHLDYFQRFEESLSLLTAGLALDPLHLDLLWSSAANLTMQKRFDEATEIINSIIQINPGYFWAYTQMSTIRKQQGDLLGELNWLRKAAEADPQNLLVLGDLACTLYLWGAIDAGDYWLGQIINAADNQETLAIVRLNRVIATGSTQEIAAATLEHLRAGRFVDYRYSSYIDLDFTLAMIELGRAQEALDVIYRLYPGSEDFAYTSPSHNVEDILAAQNVAIDLVYNISGPAAAAQNLHRHHEAVRKAGLNWDEEPTEQLLLASLLGDEQLMLQQFRTMASAPPNLEDWKFLLKRPAFEQARQLPEIAARLAEVRKAREALRDDVQSMLQGPDWPY